MKYSLSIINSNNVYDYWEDSAEGIRYDNLTKEEVNALMELSLNQNFSIIVQKYEEEE